MEVTELPAGKLDANEDQQHCAERELRALGDIRELLPLFDIDTIDNLQALASEGWDNAGLLPSQRRVIEWSHYLLSHPSS